MSPETLTLYRLARGLSTVPDGAPRHLHWRTVEAAIEGVSAWFTSQLQSGRRPIRPPYTSDIYPQRQFEYELVYPPEIVVDGDWSGIVKVGPLDEARRKILTYARPRDRQHRRIFVTSMADILHRLVPIEWIGEVVIAMAGRPDHTWMLLSKRADRWPELAAYVIAKLGYWPANVWPGVTVENQRYANERIPYLLQVPGTRWLSMEPLLGEVDLPLDWHKERCGGCVQVSEHGYDCPGHDVPGDHGIAWVIAGSESGSERRPTNEAWIRSLRDQCAAAGVPFWYKQGEVGGKVVSVPTLDGRQWMEFPSEVARG